MQIIPTKHLVAIVGLLTLGGCGGGDQGTGKLPIADGGGDQGTGVPIQISHVLGNNALPAITISNIDTPSWLQGSWTLDKNVGTSEDTSTLVESSSITFGDSSKSYVFDPDNSQLSVNQNGSKSFGWKIQYSVNNTEKWISYSCDEQSSTKLVCDYSNSTDSNNLKFSMTKNK